MTEAQQRRFYFPAWNNCAKANAWRDSDLKGRIAGPRSEQANQVMTLARQRALQAGRSIAADDLRHGCHIVAIGRDKASADLDNKELDRVVALFRLLTDPENLSFIMAWENPAQAEERRVNWFLKNAAPDGYVRHIAQDQFGTRDWESLPLQSRRFLATTIGTRSRKKPIPGARYTPRPIPRKQTDKTESQLPQLPPVKNGVYMLKPELKFQPKPKTENPF